MVTEEAELEEKSEEQQLETEEAKLLEEEKSAEDRLSAVAERALRGPRRGVYEQILADLLIKANRTDEGLKKICNVCQAAYLSKQKDKLDMELVEACFAVCNSLLSTVVDKDSLVIIAWSFPETEENWKKYIDPWQELALRFYPFETRYGKRNYPKRYAPPISSLYYEEEANRRLEDLEVFQRQVAKEIRQMPRHESFFQVTSALSTSSFYALKAEFERWAISKLALAQAVIAEEIDPEIYREMLELRMGKEEKGEEKGEKSAK